MRGLLYRFYSVYLFSGTYGGLSSPFLQRLPIFGHVWGSFFTVFTASTYFRARMRVSLFTIFTTSAYFRARMRRLLYRFYNLSLFLGTYEWLMAFFKITISPKILLLREAAGQDRRPKENGHNPLIQQTCATSPKSSINSLTIYSRMTRSRSPRRIKTGSLIFFTSPFPSINPLCFSLILNIFKE